MFTEIPANNLSLSMRKPIYGVGINDANYTVQPTINGKIVICPFYTKWTGMLKRCYSPQYQEKHPTYVECTVTSEWLFFSVFKSWMANQDWKNKAG